MRAPVRPALFALAGAALALCAAGAPPLSHAERSLHVHVDELPEWASYASNVMYESTEYWSERLPGTEFYVADSIRGADFHVQWVRDFGVEHIGYAYGNRFIEVGLGDSHCMDRWHPYSGRHVAQIMTHEIGHILGYGHSDDPSSIMYPVALEWEYGTVETDLPAVENHASYVPFCTSRDVASFEYHVSIDDPVYGFDVYVVPSRDSLDKWSDGESFKHYSSESCFGEGYLKYGGRCEGVSGSGGLLVTTGDDLTERLATITVKYREVSPGGGGGGAARAAPADPAPPRTPTPGGGSDGGRADPVPVPPEAGAARPEGADVSIPRRTSVPGCEANDACYVPSDAAIGAGGTVTWRNNDVSSHTVIGGTSEDGPDGGFDSGLIGPRSSFAHTFAAAGTYPYFCVIHPWMSGTVRVEGGSVGGRSGGGIVADRGTVAVDSDFYSVKYGQTVYATVSGTLYDREDGDRVAITITRPDGNTDGSIIFTTENGRFSMPVLLDSKSPSGMYEVMATFRGKVVGTAMFQVDGALPPPVPPRPLPTAAPDPPPAAPAAPAAQADQRGLEAAGNGPDAPDGRAGSDAGSDAPRPADVPPPAAPRPAEPSADSSPAALCGPGTALDEDGVCQIVGDAAQDTPASDAEPGGGCLVATAAYGTELAPQVQALRELRDGVAQESAYGAALMAWLNGAYYAVSPAVADLERQSPLFRQAVQAALAPAISSLALV